MRAPTFNVCGLAMAILLLASGSALAQETVAVSVRYEFLSNKFLERVGIDLSRNDNGESKQAKVLSIIEAYFLLDHRDDYIPEFMRGQITFDRWYRFRIPHSDSMPGYKGQSHPEMLPKRSIAIRISRTKLADKFRVETWEIKNQRFVNGTRNQSIIAFSDEVMLVLIRGNGVIIVGANPN